MRIEVCDSGSFQIATIPAACEKSADPLVITIRPFILEPSEGFSTISLARKGDHELETMAARNGLRLCFCFGGHLFTLHSSKRSCGAPSDEGVGSGSFSGSLAAAFEASVIRGSGSDGRSILARFERNGSRRLGTRQGGVCHRSFRSREDSSVDEYAVDEG